VDDGGAEILGAAIRGGALRCRAEGHRALKQRGDGSVTPYRASGARQGGGCDCLAAARRLARGRRAGAGRSLPIDGIWVRAAGEDGLWQGRIAPTCSRESLTDEAPCDVLALFRMRSGGGGKHLGMATNGRPQARFYPCYSEVTGLLKAPLGASRGAGRIVARFEFRRRRSDGTILLQTAVCRDCGSVGGRSRGFPRSGGACVGAPWAALITSGCWTRGEGGRDRQVDRFRLTPTGEGALYAGLWPMRVGAG